MDNYIQQDIFNNTELDKRLDSIEAKAELGIKRGDNIRRGFFARLNDEKKLRQVQDEQILELKTQMNKLQEMVYSFSYQKVG